MAKKQPVRKNPNVQPLPPSQPAATASADATSSEEDTEFVAMTHDPLTGEAHWFSPVSGDRILAMQELDPRKAQAIATAIAHASQIAWQIGRQELYKTTSHHMTRALGFTGQPETPASPGATNVVKK